jgi:hypothetical protein
MKNLYSGDNLELLSNRKKFPDASVDLVYLDPQFNSNAVYNGDAGRITSKLWHDKDYPRIEILTVAGLLSGTERIDAPPQLNPFAMAARESAREKQTEFL